MLKLTGKISLHGSWKLDPKGGPASIPNEPDVPPETPDYTVGQAAFLQVGTATPTNNNERNGRSLDVFGNTMVVGAANYNANVGRAFIYEYDGTNWGLTQTLPSPAGAGAAYFGWASATNGAWTAVGAYNQYPNSTTPYGGVLLYRKNPTWPTAATQTIVELNSPNFYFGYSLAMTSNTLAVGAYADTGNSIATAGQVYIYTLSGSTWSKQAAVDAGANAQANARFGWATSLDGDTLVVGAPAENSNAGAVYVFTRSGSTWTRRARLVPTTPIANSLFGASVRIVGGNIVVGAPASFNEDVNVGSSSAVYLFTGSGDTWTQEQVFTVSTTAGSTLVDANYGAGAFGQGIDITADGKTLIAGAYRAAANGKANGGAVYVFEKVAGVWGPSALSNSASALRPATAGPTTNPEYFGYQARFHNNVGVVATAPYRYGTTLQPNRGGIFYFK